jgi:hypothetical protein
MSDFQNTQHNLQNGQTGEEGLPTTLHSGNMAGPLYRAHAHSCFIPETASVHRDIP